jgi:hypothetical protein
VARELKLSCLHYTLKALCHLDMEIGKCMVGYQRAGSVK